MPGFDHTGPMGYGPRTGGGFGYCGGTPVPYRGRAYCGWGRGHRRYWGAGARWVAPDFSAEDEKLLLNSELNSLKKEMDQISARLKELENEEKDS